MPFKDRISDSNSKSYRHLVVCFAIVYNYFDNNVLIRISTDKRHTQGESERDREKEKSR